MKKAKILCAANVSDDAYAYICERIAGRFGAVNCERETDESLLGGFIVLYDGKIYDMSLRTQLQAMRGSLDSKE
ncbi:MAG: F0F1 ATP synthase subunit delta [Clostridia bacterium]|nr:F0F1 ATP synthase subunit delta [Clostridia bacterium]